jgi:hypothetical protein
MQTTMTTKDADVLNHLLRGEISATETYEQAIGKFTDPADRTVANAITRLRDEHQRSVDTLRSRVSAHGGTPADGAGVWGVFANAVAGAAKLIGPQTALAALKQGELHGIDDYEKAVANQEVTPETRFLIRNELLPRCREHVANLDGILDQLEEKK